MKPWVFATCCALALACDGVGRELVGSHGEPSEGDLTCQPVVCRDILFATIPPVPATTTDPALTSCTPPDPAACEPVSEPAPDLARRERAPCRRALSLDDGFDADALRELSCAKLELSRRQPGAAVIQLPDVRWSQLELEIESADPLRLELTGAQLSRVTLELRGPIEVQVRNGGSLKAVAVTGDDAASAFSLDAGQGELVRFGAEEREFAGQLRLVRSNLNGAEVRARSLHFETVGLGSATIAAFELDWIDVTARAVRVEADQLTVSASRFLEVEIARCGELGIYRSRLAGFRIPACAGDRARLFESSFERGAIDGVVAADMSEFGRTIFGVNEPTILQFWDGTLNETNFCAGTERVVIAGKTAAVCAVCREVDGTRVPVDACAHPRADTQILKCCSALSELPICEPEPERMRPPLK